MEYIVKALAELAGITPRTLRWYDQKGLLKPRRTTGAGYRLYGPREVDRLQDILFYKEMGLGLEAVRELLDAPGFDRLEALQSQINPHFLYNALDSITWMIEGERNDDAVFMISELAKLFRISLSKGRTVISVQDELQHARSYMNIQKIRYKQKFSVTFDIDPVVYSYCCVKLVLQPILENAINYGVNSMDDSGEIIVTGQKREETILLSVTDNGFGMSEEEAELILTDSNRVHKHGSGVGLVNVNNRIHILFGKEYGLTVKSELDEGTTVSICIPAVPYTDENSKILEKGHTFSGEEIINKEIQDK